MVDLQDFETARDKARELYTRSGFAAALEIVEDIERGIAAVRLAEDESGFREGMDE